MIKDAKHAIKELSSQPRAEACLTFVPRKDTITGEEHADQPVPKLDFKNPAVFPKNKPTGITHGLYVPGKIPANLFEVWQLQREWAVIKCADGMNMNEVVLDEWPPLEVPIVVQINGRMGYTEGMLVNHAMNRDGEISNEIVFLEIVREGGFEFSANAPVKYGIDGAIENAIFIPVDFKNVFAWAYLTIDGQLVHHPGRFRQPVELFVDCEFDDTTKTLLSVGITNKMGGVYYAFDSKAADAVENEWVKENVVPLLLDVPPGTMATDLNAQGIDWGTWLEYVMKSTSHSHDTVYSDFIIHMDFPTDVEYISRILHLGEGKRIGQMRNVTFKIDYVDAYPTKLKEAVQHNAAWDALAIWFHLGYFSYRVMAEMAKQARPSRPEVGKKLPTLVEGMIQSALKVKPEEMEKLQEGIENPPPAGSVLAAALKKFRDKQ